MITGSHGGLYPAAIASKWQMRAVIFNDAGMGLENAGVAGVMALENIGMAAAKESLRRPGDKPGDDENDGGDDSSDCDVDDNGNKDGDGDGDDDVDDHGAGDGGTGGEGGEGDVRLVSACADQGGVVAPRAERPGRRGAS